MISFALLDPLFLVATVHKAASRGLCNPTTSFFQYFGTRDKQSSK